MEYVPLAFVFGMFLVSLLYYVDSTCSKEDKKVITIELFNWCIFQVVIVLRLSRAGFMLVLLLLVAFVINPLSKRAIKNGNRK